MMRRHPSFKLFAALSFAFCLVGLAKTVYADFQLLDAIKEFGEKRYVAPQPSRLKAGPVTFHPFIKNSVEYDSNILLESGDPRGDVVFNIQPGAIIEAVLDKHQIVAGYEADFEIFSKPRHARQNDQNQSFFVLADLNFPNWYINVLEVFKETSGRAGTTFTERIPRFDQSIHPKVGYKWKRFTLEAGYRHFLRDFRRQGDDVFDFQMNEWTAVLFYDLFARLKALFEGQVGQIDYDDNYTRNGTFTQFRLGLEGDIIPNLSVKLRTGVQFRNYETSSEPDFNSFVGALELRYAWRQNLIFNLDAERTPIEATFGDVNYYLRHRIAGGFEYQVRYQWVFFQEFQYFRDNYAERAASGSRFGYRHDNHFGTETGLKYTPQDWLQFQLSYQFLRRDSNFSTFDYTDHRVTLSSTLAY